MNNQQGNMFQKRQQELTNLVLAELQQLHDSGYSIQFNNLDTTVDWMMQRIGAQLNEREFVKQQVYQMTIGKPQSSLNLGTTSQPSRSIPLPLSRASHVPQSSIEPASKEKDQQSSLNTRKIRVPLPFSGMTEAAQATLDETETGYIFDVALPPNAIKRDEFFWVEVVSCNKSGLFGLLPSKPVYRFEPLRFNSNSNLIRVTWSPSPDDLPGEYKFVIKVKGKSVAEKLFSARRISRPRRNQLQQL